MEFIDADTGIFMQYEATCNIPHIGNVAAGVPITVDLEYERYVKLPKEWLIAGNDTFALTVTGDSMTGAGIEIGDTGIVNRQQTAHIGDIAVVLIDNEGAAWPF